MKVILAVVVAVVIALVAINYLKTGEFSLMPPSSGGTEEGQVDRLRDEFKNLAREYRQAQRQAAVAGLNTTEAASAALAEINLVEKNVGSLAANAASDEVRSKARTLLEEIKKYKRDIQ